MKRDTDKVSKLRALVVELSVAAEDMEEYNLVEDNELYMLPSIVLSVRDIVREELRKVEEERDCPRPVSTGKCLRHSGRRIR